MGRLAVILCHYIGLTDSIASHCIGVERSIAGAGLHQVWFWSCEMVQCCFVRIVYISNDFDGSRELVICNWSLKDTLRHTNKAPAASSTAPASKKSPTDSSDP